MGVIGDKLNKALEAKSVNTNINNYVWRGPKKEVNGKFEQEEIKIIDATPEQLNQFYRHCMSMLYSKDKKNPGRYHLLNIVDEQKKKCNIELFIRWIENKYKRNIPNTRPDYPRFLFLQDVRDFLNTPEALEAYPKDKYSDTYIDAVVSNYPEEFSKITISGLMDGCLDSLGVFDKSHLSLNFIIKLGVWFTNSEKKELEERDEKTGKLKDRIDVIMERHRLKANARPRTLQTGLSYAEFRAMLNLKSKKYSELTTDQLVALRNKVLFRFQNEIEYHAFQWEDRIKQIKEVAAAKGISLEKVNIADE